MKSLRSFVLRSSDINERNPLSVQARDAAHAVTKFEALHAMTLTEADVIPFADFKIERDSVQEIMRWNREEMKNQFPLI